MKRPMFILAVSWLAGIVLAGRETAFGTNFVLLSYFLLIIIGLLVQKHYPQILLSKIQMDWYPQLTLLLLLIPCLFLAGYFRMEHYAGAQTEQELPWKLLEEEGEVYVTVEGVVCAKTVEKQVILELKNCSIIGYYGQENQTAGNCRILVEGEGKEWLPETFIGNKIRVFGKFSTFQPASNPGQFDARQYYTGQGLFSNVSALRITILDDSKSGMGHAMFVWKQKLRESSMSLYPKEKAGVLIAMLFGDKDILPEETETLYRQNGISHILAISGLHISMLCMGLFRILRKLTVPHKLAAGLATAFLVFYLVFTGASTSSLRAGIMCLVMLMAGLLRRSYDLLSSLSFAAILVTALRPMELASAGFLLSFGAVLGVSLAKELEYGLWQEEEKRPWWNIFLYGGMIQLVTLPVSLWFFYELSPYSIFLNLLVIPLVSLILGGGILSAVLGIGFPVIAKLPVGGTYLILEFYEWLCGMTQKLPFSFVLLGRPHPRQMMLYYGGLAIVLYMLSGRRENPGKRISGAWAFVGLFCTMLCLFLPGKTKAELLFLDVSQGDCVLITTQSGTAILSDCGSSDVNSVGEYRLSPVLKQKGIGLIDMAVVSHLDSDHMSGIQELLEAMPVYHGEMTFNAGYEGVVGVKELVLPLVREKSEAYSLLEELALEKNVAVRYLQSGEQLYQEEEMLIECIYPANAQESENDTSLVLLLQTPSMLAWLMGDAGISPEKEIMKRLSEVDMEALRKDRKVLLKVGHHGSKTSSGEGFLSFLHPDIAVISCGYQNIYGHPHKEVLDRLAAVRILVFRTDLQGAVLAEPGKNGAVLVRSWRKDQRK